jgi:sigma-B regulation protein RsbU (phosphoserine phosphatase)
MDLQDDKLSLDRDLRRERFAMHSLLEFARTLTPDLGPQGILKSVLRTIMGKGLIVEGFAYLSMEKGEETHWYNLIAKYGLRGVELASEISFDTLETWLLKPPDRTGFTVPIFDSDQQEIIGVLGFGKTLSPDGDISLEQNYLESLSLLTGIALTNASLFESEKARERFEAELRLAREIQQSLLPQSFPDVNGFSFTAFSKQSELVGGDYYDIIKLNDDQALIAIADVVGKGVSAAILMSNLQASLHALLTSLRSGVMSLPTMVKELNRLVYESTAAEKYITAVFAIVDSKAEQITSIVCGHPRPILHTGSGQYKELVTSGVPLGILPNFEYKEFRTDFKPGSYCTFYTDGLSEAVSKGKMLGEKGVESFLDSLKGTDFSSKIIEEKLFKNADLIVSDDITFVTAQMS